MFRVQIWVQGFGMFGNACFGVGLGLQLGGAGLFLGFEQSRSPPVFPHQPRRKGWVLRFWVPVVVSVMIVVFSTECQFS